MYNRSLQKVTFTIFSNLGSPLQENAENWGNSENSDGVVKIAFCEPLYFVYDYYESPIGNLGKFRKFGLLGSKSCILKFPIEHSVL